MAFLDESRKPLRDSATRRLDTHGRKHYVVAAAVVIDGDSPNIRSRLKQIEAEGGYPLHYQDLSTARRVKALEAIDGIDGWDGYLYETARGLPDAGHSEHHVRAKVIERALTHLSSEGVVKATLETRAGTNRRFLPLDNKDHDVMRRLQRQQAIPGSFRISHNDKTEAILQIADLLAGAHSDALRSQPGHLLEDQPPCPRDTYGLRRGALNAQRPRDYDPQPTPGRTSSEVLSSRG
ncbi:MAG: DUF3800 domain-containing protein [Acidimicrobiia bacterium]|nr:DUF3800 domain-containing protein [Acidimicrobiia bacterium]